MKRNIRWLASSVLLYATLLIVTPLYGGFVKTLFQGEQTAQKVFATDVQVQRDMLGHITNELSSYQEKTEEFASALQQSLHDNEEYIAHAQRVLEQSDPDSVEKAFLTQKIALLKEIRQQLLSTRITRKDIISTFEQHKKILEGYLKDPQFSAFKLEIQSFYTIEDLERASKSLFDQDIRIKRLADQKEDMVAELAARRKELSARQKEYADQRNEQKEFQAKTTVPTAQEGDKKFSIKQQGQLLDLEVVLSGVRLDLARMREKQSKSKNSLLGTQLFFEKQKQRVLKDNLALVKVKLRVDEGDIEQEFQELAKVKHETTTRREGYFRKIGQLSSLREQVQKRLEKEPGAAVDVSAQVDWRIEADAPQAYQQAAYIDYLHEQLLFYDRNIELLNVQLELENVKKRVQRFKVESKQAWYDVTQGLLRESEALLEEIKKYKELVAQEERNITSLVEKRKAATELLTVENRSLETLKDDIKQLIEQKDKLFAGAPGAFRQTYNFLVEAHAVLEKEIAANQARIDAYSTIMTLLGQVVKDAKLLLEELETKSIWQRSEYAITMEGVKNLVPDIKMFFANVHLAGLAYREQLSFKNLAMWFGRQMAHLGSLLFFLIFLLVFVGAVWLLKQRILPQLQSMLLATTPTYRVFFVLNRIAAALLGFLADHVVGVTIWCVVFALIRTGTITAAFPRIIFYLASIPYWIYFAHRIIDHIRALNVANDYTIFSQEFERAITITFSVLAYVTIGILFFRQAFMIATIRSSQTPRILLAIYSIVARVLIPALLFQLFSIGRKEIVGMLPERGTFWQFLADKINRYYYVSLVGIIILMLLSDPYVGGYGNLVSYILKGFAGTFLLLWALSVLHSWGKQISSNLFFSSEDDTFKERFSAAKTWYGLFTIVLFVVLGIFGVVIGLRMWGITIGLEDLYNFFEYEIFPVIEDGEKYSFTLQRFLSLIVIIISGFLLASAVNRFVLRRIFSIIPVNLGVQNAVMSMTRWGIILVVFLVAFMWAKLSSMLLTIGIVIGSITYVFKEPLADFFSYFIILVQRPIQIGDYILITDEVQGVVRRITPRSVILRRKNSYNIVVPNSLVVKDPISNWNYARNFVAFDDIEFTVPYTSNPEQVRQIMFGVLDKNLSVLKSPAPVVRLVGFGEYGFEFMVRGFVTETNVLNKWDIASDIRFSILKALREHGIKLAIPTRLILSKEPSGEDTHKSSE